MHELWFSSYGGWKELGCLVMYASMPCGDVLFGQYVRSEGGGGVFVWEWWMDQALNPHLFTPDAIFKSRHATDFCRILTYHFTQRGWMLFLKPLLRCSLSGCFGDYAFSLSSSSSSSSFSSSFSFALPTKVRVLCLDSL